MPLNSRRNHPECHWLGMPALLNPEEGTTIVEPPEFRQGFWAGAPSALFDEERGRFYLYYRLRKPREQGRGVACRIAESEDGMNFTTIWEATQQQIGTPSMERAAVVKCVDGKYRCYLSYVNPKDNRWQIDLMEAEEPAGFDVTRRKPLLVPAEIGVEALKDPWVMIIGGQYYMIVSYAPTPAGVSYEEMHGTQDIHVTGTSKSCTGLATSVDGVKWEWQGDILSPPETGWDKYCTRINSLLWTPPVFTAFYDGIPDHTHNYEEQTGLAITWDLRTFVRVTPAGPALVSPHASGSLRYVDCFEKDGEIWFYYEYAREDGSHELRLNQVAAG